MMICRFKIVNRIRFTFSLLIILILLYVSANIAFKFNIVEGVGVIHYNQVYVKSGDTLWDIAKKYTTNNVDIRDVIYEICQLNNLESPDIFPGQVIKIPSEK